MCADTKVALAQRLAVALLLVCLFHNTDIRTNKNEYLFKNLALWFVVVRRHRPVTTVGRMCICDCFLAVLGYPSWGLQLRKFAA